MLVCFICFTFGRIYSHQCCWFRARDALEGRVLRGKRKSHHNKLLKYAAIISQPARRRGVFLLCDSMRCGPNPITVTLLVNASRGRTFNNILSAIIHLFVHVVSLCVCVHVADGRWAQRITHNICTFKCTHKHTYSDANVVGSPNGRSWSKKYCAQNWCQPINRTLSNPFIALIELFLVRAN